MGNFGNQAKFVDGRRNPKRSAAKKKRNFGLGFIDPNDVGSKEIVDKWCQSHDPLFKVKGKERHMKLKMKS